MGQDEGYGLVGGKADQYIDFLSHPTSETTLFMSVGKAEDPYGIVLDYVNRMAKKIRKRSYPALNFRMKRFKNENHTSVIAPAFLKGGRYTYKKLK